MCQLDADDHRFTFIDPCHVLQWAHDLINLIEQSIYDLQGIPLKFSITCTYQAKISTFISPDDGSIYLKPAQFRRDIVQQMVSQLSHIMIMYSHGRQHMTSSPIYIYSMLSINDILSFKDDMINQHRFSLIRVALDDVRIVDTSAYTRVYKPVRQRLKIKR